MHSFLKPWILLSLGLSLFLFWLIFHARSSEHPHPHQVLLILGDSLSSAYGMNPERGWVRLLNKRLQEKKYDVEIINKSVSGKTTADGLNRLPEFLNTLHPDMVLLALGSNDGLQGNPPDTMKSNLEAMIRLCQEAHAKVILVGFRLFPTYGDLFPNAFAKVFSDLAEQYHLPFIPLLLEGLEADPKYRQADNIHPNEEAQPVILDNVWKILEAQLK